MKIQNRTRYDTRTLRSLLVLVHNGLAQDEGRLRTWGHLAVGVVYSRSGRSSGWAYLDGSSMQLQLPRGSVLVSSLVWLMAHELSHSYGYRHRQMRGGLSNWTNEQTSAVERFGWRIAEAPAPVKKSRRKTPADHLSSIALRAKRWDAKLRRAQRALAKLRRQERYYQKRAGISPASSEGGDR